MVRSLIVSLSGTLQMFFGSHFQQLIKTSFAIDSNCYEMEKITKKVIV